MAEYRKCKTEIRLAGYTQQKLCEEMGWNRSATLCDKLNLVHPLTIEEAKQIKTTLKSQLTLDELFARYE